MRGAGKSRGAHYDIFRQNTEWGDCASPKKGGLWALVFEGASERGYGLRGHEYSRVRILDAWRNRGTNERAKNAGMPRQTRYLLRRVEFDGTERRMPLPRLGYLVGVPVSKHGSRSEYEEERMRDLEK